MTPEMNHEVPRSERTMEAPPTVEAAPIAEVDAAALAERSQEVAATDAAAMTDAKAGVETAAEGNEAEQATLAEQKELEDRIKGYEKEIASLQQAESEKGTLAKLFSGTARKIELRRSWIEEAEDMIAQSKEKAANPDRYHAATQFRANRHL